MFIKRNLYIYIFFCFIYFHQMSLPIEVTISPQQRGLPMLPGTGIFLQIFGGPNTCTHRPGLFFWVPNVTLWTKYKKYITHSFRWKKIGEWICKKCTSHLIYILYIYIYLQFQVFLSWSAINPSTRVTEKTPIARVVTVWYVCPSFHILGNIYIYFSSNFVIVSYFAHKLHLPTGQDCLGEIYLKKNLFHLTSMLVGGFNPSEKY